MDTLDQKPTDAVTEALACALPAAGAAAQLGEWAAVQRVATSIEPIPSGLRMTFPVEQAANVSGLAAREQACCSFLRLSVRTSDAACVLDITTQVSTARPVIEMLAGTPLDERS